jgi:hypothetical protein
MDLGQSWDPWGGKQVHDFFLHVLLILIALIRLVAFGLRIIVKRRVSSLK